jgi:hypothetical protein
MSWASVWKYHATAVPSPGTRIGYWYSDLEDTGMDCVGPGGPGSRVRVVAGSSPRRGMFRCAVEGRRGAQKKKVMAKLLLETGLGLAVMVTVTVQQPDSELEVQSTPLPTASSSSR